MGKVSRRECRWLVLAAFAFVCAGLARADQLFVSTFGAGAATDLIVHIDPVTGVQNTIVTGLVEAEDGACHPVTRFIYFAESIPGRVTRWTQGGGNATNVIPAAAILSGPEGLSFDPAGNLYINTRDIGGSTQGAWVLPFGNPATFAASLLAPFTSFGEGTDLILAGPNQGGLLLVARGESRVYLSNPPGAAPSLIIDASAFPADAVLYGISANGCGDIFVTFKATFSNNGSVYHFDPNGNFIEAYATGMVSPTFTEFDSLGNLYVVDNAGTVWHVAPDKTRTAFAFVTNAHGVAICRDVAIPYCPVLSVHYGSSSAVRDDQGVRVTWTTTMESDTVGFDVWARDGQGVETRLPVFIYATGAGSAYEARDGRAEAHDGSATAYRVVERCAGSAGDATSWMSVEGAGNQGGGSRHRGRRP